MSHLILVAVLCLWLSVQFVSSRGVGLECNNVDDKDMLVLLVEGTEYRDDEEQEVNGGYRLRQCTRTLCCPAALRCGPSHTCWNNQYRSVTSMFPCFGINVQTNVYKAVDDF